MHFAVSPCHEVMKIEKDFRDTFLHSDSTVLVPKETCKRRDIVLQAYPCTLSIRNDLTTLLLPLAILTSVVNKITQ